MINVERLRADHEIFKQADKRPRPGCIESGHFADWSCCEHHRFWARIKNELTEDAIALTQELFPGTEFDAVAPSMAVLEGELMSVLSEHWWQLVDAAIAQH